MNQEGQNAIQLKELHHNKEDAALGKTSDDDKTELSTLIERQGHCPLTAAHLQTAALVISWLSIVFSLGTGIAGLVLSVAGKSEALFAYGLDAILDSFSSVAVVWRFQVKVDHIYCAKRERKACIVIGFLFIVSATSLIAKAVDAIIVEIRETKQIVLYESFALSCGIISVLIATAKIYVGLKIGSQALYTDSIITYVGAATCFAGVAGLELYVQNTNLWYLDSVFGIICGLFLLLFGIKLLYTKLREKDIEEQDF